MSATLTSGESTISMYDLCGRDDRRFSPYCWRTKLAFAHKGVPLESVATAFTDMDKIDPGNKPTLPTLRMGHDGTTLLTDSWDIALWLDKTYPDAPTLIGDGASEAYAEFIQNYTNVTLHLGVAQNLIKDVHDHLQPKDQAYFRENREGRFKKTLEEVQSGREDRVVNFQRSLSPVRAVVRKHDFLGGKTPNYADYTVFGALQWARVTSDFRLLEEDDAVTAWRDRVAALYDGLGNSVPHYY